MTPPGHRTLPWDLVNTVLFPCVLHLFFIQPFRMAVELLPQFGEFHRRQGQAAIA